MRTIKPRTLASKAVLDRRKTPSKSPLPPALQPQTSFRRRIPVQSTLLALPISSPTTYLTLHDFPSMRPARLCPYPSTFLRAPMRKDILHRAVLYEDNLARGTGGHTKTRGEVKGSTRKIFPQKGTGRARAGARVAPGRRGGITFPPSALI
jgi:large subunit ribosomal protein L4